jgi:hypothetical protein
MIVSVIALTVAAAALAVAVFTVSQSRTDARNCARDARAAAAAARAAAESVAKVDNTDALVHIEAVHIPAGALPPTIPIPIDRARQRTRQSDSPRTIPGAGADEPRAGSRATS